MHLSQHLGGSDRCSGGLLRILGRMQMRFSSPRVLFAASPAVHFPSAKADAHTCPSTQRLWTCAPWCLRTALLISKISHLEAQPPWHCQPTQTRNCAHKPAIVPTLSAVTQHITSLLKYGPRKPPIIRMNGGGQWQGRC